MDLLHVLGMKHYTFVEFFQPFFLLFQRDFAFLSIFLQFNISRFFLLPRFFLFPRFFYDIVYCKIEESIGSIECPIIASWPDLNLILILRSLHRRFPCFVRFENLKSR